MSPDPEKEDRDEMSIRGEKGGCQHEKRRRAGGGD